MSDRQGPDPRGELSANGVKVWGPRLPADPRRAERARRAVIDLVLRDDPWLMQATGGLLRQTSQCAVTGTGTSVPCGR